MPKYLANYVLTFNVCVHDDDSAGVLKTGVLWLVSRSDRSWKLSVITLKMPERGRIAYSECHNLLYHYKLT